MKGKRKGHVGITLPGNLAVESGKRNMFFQDVRQIIKEKNIYITIVPEHMAISQPPSFLSRPYL
jgi:hypothetical protein